MSLLYEVVDAVDRPPTFLLRAREVEDVIVVAVHDNEQEIIDWCSRHNLAVTVVGGEAIIYRSMPSISVTLAGDVLAIDTTERSKIVLLRDALTELLETL